MSDPTKKIRCPHPECDGGQRFGRENDRNTQEGCYTCGGTGRITEAQYRDRRRSEMFEILGADVVAAMRQSANSDPEGEGWDFHAAENQMSGYEFAQVRAAGEAEKISRLFKRLEDEGHGDMIDALVDRIVPFDEDLRIKPKAAQPAPVPVGNEADIPF